jgi:hypothetical protein
MVAMNYLPLAFPKRPPVIALGGANGGRLRYELLSARGKGWELEIQANGLKRTRSYATKAQAEQAAKDDFRRRKFLRVA